MRRVRCDCGCQVSVEVGKSWQFIFFPRSADEESDETADPFRERLRQPECLAELFDRDLHSVLHAFLDQLDSDVSASHDVLLLVQSPSISATANSAAMVAISRVLSLPPKIVTLIPTTRPAAFFTAHFPIAFNIVCFLLPTHAEKLAETAHEKIKTGVKVGSGPAT